MCEPKDKSSTLNPNRSRENKVPDPPLLYSEFNSVSYGDEGSRTCYFDSDLGRMPTPWIPRAEDYPLTVTPEMALKNSQSGKSQLFVPGCSAAKPTGSDDKQTISNSMMQAYIAMRGPDMGEINDPLFEWIQSHNDEMTRKAASQPHGTPEPADNPRDVTEMLGYMDKAIGSDNMGGDSPRAAIFELRRPTINHIAPPAVMNLVPHRRAYSATDHRIPAWGDDGDDEDDDEGAVPTGRLSPCTFLQWSQDCKRWVRKEIMDPKNVLAKAKRMRPTEPVPARDHYPYYLEDAKAQRDHFTGEEFSPLYQVPHSPSLIYTPPGVPSVSYAPTAFLAQYDRMAPLDAKKLRDHVYGKTEKSMPPTSTNDKFTDSEVNNVANRITRSEGCGIPGSEIYAFLKAQYKAISKEQAEDETLRKRISAQTKRIHELEIERDGLREHFIPLLKKKRSEYRADQEQRALQALQEQRDIRDSRIREHLGNHIREVQLILDRSYMQRSESKQKFKANQQRLAQLEQEIIEDCRIAGTSPQDIYDELNNLVPPPLGPTWSVAKGVSHSAESFCRALDDNTTYPTSAAAKESKTQVGEEPRMGTVDSVSGRTLVNPTRDRSLASFSLDVGQTVRDHTISSRDHHSLSSANKTTFPSGHNPQGEYASGPYRASDYGRDRPIPFGSQPMPNPRMDTTVHNTIPGKTEESSSTQGNLREKDKGSSHIPGPNQRICFAPPPGKPDPIDRSFYD